ncbi:unnamed protein product, partial [Allacma fusca]
RGIEMVST